jgi:hypothetical protein
MKTITLSQLTDLVASGLSVIPTTVDGQKRPLVKEWKKYQTTPPTLDELRTWADRYHGVGVIMGWVSGGLECIDVDTKNDPTNKMWDELLFRLTCAGDFADKLVIETTPSGGKHIFYRYGDAHTVRDGNLKLAYAAHNQQAMIETRGAGGYALCDPSVGYEVFRGAMTEIEAITHDDRDTIIEICRSFNEVAPEVERTKAQYLNRTEGKPGDDFNARMTRDEFAAMLTTRGWKAAYEKDGVVYFTRPGKDKGVSASLFYGGRMLLHMFTSSVPFFEPSRSYDPFGVYTRFEHDNDFRKASSALAAAGYGQKAEDPTHGPAETSDPIRKYLNEHYRFRYNEVLGRDFYAHNRRPNDWQPVTDRFVNTLHLELDDARIPKASVARLFTIIQSEFAETYAPFVEWYESLPPHNGTEYIEALADTITVPEALRYDWRKWLTKWLVAHVQQIVTGRSNHTALILRGGQGIGKTTWLNNLCPVELRDYLHVGSLKVNDKDSELKLTEQFLINLDEFETMQRAEVGHLKSLMTKDQIGVRRPYARSSEVLRRWASFMGSVNKAEFLTDDTGNRRFMIVDTEQIRHDHDIDIKRVWAQAKDLWLNGYQHYLSQDEIERLNRHNEEYRKKTQAENLVTQYLEVPESQLEWEWHTITEICEWLQGNVDIKLNIGTYFMQELGAALTNGGYLSSKRKGKKGYYVKFKHKVKNVNDIPQEPDKF